MARKTVNLTNLTARVNAMLAHLGTDESRPVELREEGATALCVMLEHELMEADQYRGFRVLDSLVDERPTPCRGRAYYTSNLS